MNKRYEDNDEDRTSRVVRFVSSKGANKDARWDKDVDEDEGLGKGSSNNGRLLLRLFTLYSFLLRPSCIYESGEHDCRLQTANWTGRSRSAACTRPLMQANRGVARDFMA